MSIVIYSPNYNNVLFMTRVKNALGLLLLNSTAVYCPKIVPLFYTKIHSNKARHQKNQHLISTA